jgi:hypothetical protein
LPHQRQSPSDWSLNDDDHATPDQTRPNLQVTSIINAIAIPRLLRPLPHAITLCLICCIAQAGAQQPSAEPRANPAPDLTALKKEATAVQSAIAELPDASNDKLK